MTREQCIKCIYKEERCGTLYLSLIAFQIIKCMDYIWNGELENN